MGRALWGGRAGVALWVGGEGWKVVMLRRRVEGCGWRVSEARRARREDFRMGSIVVLFAVCGEKVRKELGWLVVPTLDGR